MSANPDQSLKMQSVSLQANAVEPGMDVSGDGKKSRELTMLGQSQEQLQPLQLQQQQEPKSEPLFLPQSQSQLNVKRQDPIDAIKEIFEILTQRHSVFCAKKGEERVIALLSRNRLEIGYKIDLNTRDKDGNTMLHYAVRKQCSFEIVKMLIEDRADPNLKNNNGDTPLHFAAKIDGEDAYCMSRNQITVILPKIIEFLISSGADVNIKNTQGLIPCQCVGSSYHAALPALIAANTDKPKMSHP